MPEVLYSNKCYTALKHFVPLLTQFEQLKCQMPCDLKYLAAFAEQVLCFLLFPCILPCFDCVGVFACVCVCVLLFCEV